MSLSPKLPAGYRLVKLETTDSTNAEAMRRANAGEPGPLWVWSARQSSGRGRQGREWHSQTGNLFASLLIGVACPIRTAPQLALVAGVAAYDTIDKLMSVGNHPEILLKWPNDVMLEDAKVAGMLLESAERKVSNRLIVVIGTGINVARHPEDLAVPATSLAAHGINVTTAQALETLADLTNYWLGRWDNGAMFGVIRRAWLDRAGPTGRPLRVRIKDEQETEGLFAGLDSEGGLRLLMSDGAERRVAAGDVFFGTP
ncbi:MAG TPA: biotin--[acetyl-CoA-carboxylase] ligase [Methyloceanibacter sp.]|jgi:BirA family biotin operon repressor/biotin-[acetyl-CoA-carboxylase] ligase